jgi:hypothetical protein
MSNEYTPNFEFLDEEERDLEHLDASKALPEPERLAALEAFRRAYRNPTPSREGSDQQK